MNSGKGIVLTGVIVNVFPSEFPSQNFEKRVLWLTQSEGTRYPEVWEIQFQQGDCNKLDGFAPGDAVNVDIEIKGKAWTNKNGVKSVFNTLKGLDIAKQGAPDKTPSNRQKTGTADGPTGSRYSLDKNAYNDGEASN